MCKMLKETKEELFRDCEISKGMWDSSNLGMRVEMQQKTPLQDWISNNIYYSHNKRKDTQACI